MNTMLYPELYRSLEAVRWDMEKDIPWEFDASLLTDEQAKTIKMNAITESVLPRRKCSCATTSTTATFPRS